MNEQNDKNLELALWRYGIISPLLHRDANDLPSGELLDQASWNRYVHPNGSHVTLSAETLRKWLYRYLHFGLPGLMGKTRSDKGSHQIPDDITTAMVALRIEHPRWTIARMIKQLAKTRKWNGRKPSRSAIYRYAKAHNLQRDPHINPEQTRPFAFDHFGQLWLADYLHRPQMFYGEKKKKTYHSNPKRR